MQNSQFGLRKTTNFKSQMRTIIFPDNFMRAYSREIPSACQNSGHAENRVFMRELSRSHAYTAIQYTFLTNHLTLVARTIIDIYKARWQVELFFKWVKQNLKIKRFLGASKHAVMTPIGIAICVYLLLSYIKFLNPIRPSLQQILRLLQLNLFERRDLLALLRGDPPEPPVSPNQAALVFS